MTFHEIVYRGGWMRDLGLGPRANFVRSSTLVLPGGSWGSGFASAGIGTLIFGSRQSVSAPSMNGIFCLFSHQIEIISFR